MTDRQGWLLPAPGVTAGPNLEFRLTLVSDSVLCHAM